MIRTLLVDDSPAFLAALRGVLAEDPVFEVVGEARDGLRALQLAVSLKPELVLMDVQMPGADGIATTAHIMRDAPCPVVVMSGMVSAERQATVFEAMRAGAVDVLPKPRDLSVPDVREKLRGAIKAMAQVKVVRRRNLAPGAPAAIVGDPVQVVALGSSTGGPPALCQLLSQLPRDFRPAVLIAQHLAPGFGAGLCQWLASACALPLERVEKRSPRQGGRVYLAADGHHLMAEGKELLAVPSAPGDLSVPGVDKLFGSLVGMGAAVIAAVLTGMGSDGAKGLLALRQAGAYTLVQDESTSLIYGMPRVARERGGAMEELPLRELAARIVELSRAGVERVGR